MTSACFLKDNNQNYIVTYNNDSKNERIEPINIFDLEGNKIKELKILNIMLILLILIMTKIYLKILL